MSEALTFIGGRVVTGDGAIIEHGAVTVADGRIVAVGEAPESGTRRDVSGLTLLPGFLDVHIHGGGGADTMDATPEALRTIARTHARYGTTGLLATTITQSREAISAALENARIATLAGPEFCPDGAAILGIHLEGPYISPERPGAQPKQFVRDYNPDEFTEWLRIAGGTLRLITLAPERPAGAELLAACRAERVVVSLGHTDATVAETTEAIAQGAAHGTHLFNAMPSLHHRKPGPIAALLTDDRVRVEIIADGHHVAPESVLLAYRAKGADGVILITDAMSGAGATDGVYDLGGNAVTVANGKALLEDGTLAGSVLTMEAAARNARRWLDLNWNGVAKLTSGNAARQFGWSQKGKIAPGADADLTLVDDDLNVQATVVAGRVVYQR